MCLLSDRMVGVKATAIGFLLFFFYYWQVIQFDNHEFCTVWLEYYAILVSSFCVKRVFSIQLIHGLAVLGNCTFGLYAVIYGKHFAS